MSVALEFNELPRGNGDAAGVRKIAETLSERGIDAASDLYDEAVGLAQEGQLARSRDRLRMLLCLDPQDGQAHLLLAKVFGAQGRWTDALSELDHAAACGMRLPPGLRESFEHKRDSLAERRNEKIVARTEGELRALRDEARRLRAENSRLEQEARDLGDKTRLWMSATAVIGGMAVFALLLGVVFDGDSETVEETASTLTLTDEAPVPAEVEPIAPPPEVAAASMVPEVAPIPVGPRTYTVQKGDNLSVVSKRMYGTSTRWEELRDANAGVLEGGIDLQVGMKLTIPE